MVSIVWSDEATLEKCGNFAEQIEAKAVSLAKVETADLLRGGAYVVALMS